MKLKNMNSWYRSEDKETYKGLKNILNFMKTELKKQTENNEYENIIISINNINLLIEYMNGLGCYIPENGEIGIGYAVYQ